MILRQLSNSYPNKSDSLCLIKEEHEELASLTPKILFLNKQNYDNR